MPVDARTWTIEPGGPLTGTVALPGDKSIAHRSLMLGSLSDGAVRVRGAISGEDVAGTRRAMEALGVLIEDARDSVTIHGAGAGGLKRPDGVLDLGNSGTAMRLLAGVLAGQPFETVLTGDRSLRSRPMDRVIDPLRLMGARIRGDGGGTLAPLTIRGARLKGIAYDVPVPSAQVKSCVLLAGLFAEGDTVVKELAPTRDHTERMLRHLGGGITVDGNTIRLRPGPLTPAGLFVPGDFSAAAFFLVAATLVAGSDLTIENVGVNPLRTGFLRALREMGADIELSNERDVAGEPVADLRVRASPLSAIDLPPAWLPSMIDEVPALAVAAAFADGVTRVTEARELRVKESDRIATVAKNLRTLGVRLVEHPDGMEIEGGGVDGGIVESFGDHRVAMSFAVAATAARKPLTIRGVACADTSFPGFAAALRAAGATVSES